MIYDELNTAFRWYNSLSRQNRFKNACAAMCDFALPSVCNDILPFQIKTSAFGTPTTWKVIYLDGNITIPETLASATLNFTSTGAGNIQIFVSGYGLIGTGVWAGSLSATLDATCTAVNANINGFEAERVGNSIEFTAPVGSGDSLNGVAISATTSGSITCTNTPQNFSGGVDESTGTELDISSCAAYINKHTEENGDIYLTYNGGSISNCIPKQFDCGKWYSTIEDENGIIFYSEVFEVVLIENADTVYPALDPSLFSAFRFYDDVDKQTRYKSYCESACNFYLIADKSRLLPFMFRASSIGNIQSFKLIGVDDGCENDLPIILLQQATYLGYDYVFYNGDDISDLPCGKFYVQVCDETQCWYSELINLVDMSAVSEVDYLLTDDGDILMTDDGEGITIS